MHEISVIWHRFTMAAKTLIQNDGAWDMARAGGWCISARGMQNFIRRLFIYVYMLCIQKDTHQIDRLIWLLRPFFGKLCICRGCNFFSVSFYIAHNTYRHKGNKSTKWLNQTFHQTTFSSIQQKTDRSKIKRNKNKKYIVIWFCLCKMCD